MPIIQKVLAIYFKLTKIKTPHLLVGSILFVLASAYGMLLIEPKTFDNSYITTVYFVFTTITTVGYGDYSPTTHTGQLYNIFVLYTFGIGMFGVIIGKLLETVVLYKRLKEEGKLKFNGENHIIIVEWSAKSKAAIEEILKSHEQTEIVLIDTLEKTPSTHDRVTYIQGDSSDEEVLKQANLIKASSVIVFADEKFHNDAIIDGKTLLVATSIESYAKRNDVHLHLIVELASEKHVESFRHVGVEEFILGNDTVSRLAVRSAFSHGISSIYNKLMSSEGEDIYDIPNQNWKTYREAFIALLEEGATLLSNGDNLDIHSTLDNELPSNSHLRIICKDEVYLKLKTKYTL